MIKLLTVKTSREDIPTDTLSFSRKHEQQFKHVPKWMDPRYNEYTQSEYSFIILSHWNFQRLVSVQIYWFLKKMQMRLHKLLVTTAFKIYTYIIISTVLSSIVDLGCFFLCCANITQLLQISPWSTPTDLH